MSFDILCLTPCSITYELRNDAIYEVDEEYAVYLDGHEALRTKRNVATLFSLSPDRDYLLRIGDEERLVHTPSVTYVLHSSDFLLEERGEDDTLALQTAIMATPRGGLLVIDPGDYHVTALFLKSHITISFAKGARLLGSTKKEDTPIGKGEYEAEGKLPLEVFAWEGAPFPGKPSLLNGFEVEDVTLVGEGILDGRADQSPYWTDVKTMPYARPRLLFLNRCKDIRVVGLSFRNTPCWTIHPYFSDGLGFYDLYIENPKDSPNTDGMDPEACDDVKIVGVRFSVGDDCIALKSGKIYIGKTFKKPCSRVQIRNCFMNEGHGAVVLGSEAGAGLKDLTIERCLFRHTDRGLRIKSRRGRGKDSVIDNVTFSHIRMNNVLTPFTINMFYFCDPDGKSEEVQSRLPRPVDESTPRLGRFLFRDIVATDAEIALGYFIGLPESPIGEIEIRDSVFTVKEDAKPGKPAMLCGVDDMVKQGFLFENVGIVRFENVSIEGQSGKPIQTINVDEVIA